MLLEVDEFPKDPYALNMVSKPSLWLLVVLCILWLTKEFLILRDLMESELSWIHNWRYLKELEGKKIWFEWELVKAELIVWIWETFEHFEDVATGGQTICVWWICGTIFVVRLWWRVSCSIICKSKG